MAIIRAFVVFVLNWVLDGCLSSCSIYMRWHLNKIKTYNQCPLNLMNEFTSCLANLSAIVDNSDLQEYLLKALMTTTKLNEKEGHWQCVAMYWLRDLHSIES